MLISPGLTPGVWFDVRLAANKPTGIIPHSPLPVFGDISSTTEHLPAGTGDVIAAQLGGTALVFFAALRRADHPQRYVVFGADGGIVVVLIGILAHSAAARSHLGDQYGLHSDLSGAYFV